MTRADFARWLMLGVLSWTVLSALTNNPIGVIIGAVYVFTAIAGTIIDVVEKRSKGAD